MKLLESKKSKQVIPDREDFYITYNRALRLGIIKKKPCIVCGSSEFRIHGHHIDYTNPLKVVWLCQKHHNERHSKIKRVTKKRIEKTKLKLLEYFPGDFVNEWSDRAFEYSRNIYYLGKIDLLKIVPLSKEM